MGASYWFDQATRSGLVPTASAVTAATLLSCASLQAQLPTFPTSIDEVVEWVDPLVLEEIPEALNARPRLALDPQGGYLVTDDMTHQVRVYQSDGELVTYFGREGDGPGEFDNLTGVARLADGGFVTVDFTGRLALWDASGGLVSDHRPPIRGALGILALDQSRVAVVMAPVTARTDSVDVPWVRYLDLADMSVGDEVLSMPLTQANVDLAATVGGEVDPTLRERFGLIWTVFDSLWVVDIAAGTTHSVHLESSVLGLNTVAVDRYERPEFVEWMLAATFPAGVFPAPGGGWLVSFYKRAPGAPGTWGLLRVDEEGRRVWELAEAPKLLTTDPDGGILFFEEPTGMAPGSFYRGRLRR